MSSPFKIEIQEQVNAILRTVGPIDRIKIAIDIIQNNTGTAINFIDVWSSDVQKVAKDKGVKIIMKSTSAGFIAGIEYENFRYLIPAEVDKNVLNRHIDIVCALFIPGISDAFSTIEEDLDATDVKLVALWKREGAPKLLTEEDLLLLLHRHKETLCQNRKIREVNPSSDAMSKIASSGGPVLDNTLTKFLNVANFVAKHEVEEIIAVGFQPANTATAMFNICKDINGDAPIISCYDKALEGPGKLDVLHISDISRLKRKINNRKCLIVSDVKVGDETMGGASQASLDVLCSLSSLVDSSSIKDFFVANVWPDNAESLQKYRDFLDDDVQVVQISKRRLHNQEIIMHCKKINEPGSIDDFISMLVPHVEKAIEMEEIRMEYFSSNRAPGKTFASFICATEEHGLSMKVQRDYLRLQIAEEVEAQIPVALPTKEVAVIRAETSESDSGKLAEVVAQCLEMSSQKTPDQARAMCGIPADVVPPYGKNSPNRPGALVGHYFSDGKSHAIVDILDSVSHRAQYDARWVAMAIITGKGAYVLTSKSPLTMSKKK